MPKILLVEDEEMLRDAFSIILSTLSCEIDVATNGEMALKKCNEKSYDLILLDLMMPVMNGLDFLKEFTKIANTVDDTKIIVMSNLSSSRLLDSALEYDVRCSILKSDLSPTHLVELVREQLTTTRIPAKT